MNKLPLNLKTSLAIVVLSLFSVSLVSAQSRYSTRPYEKNHSDIKKVFAKLTQPFGKSTVRINEGDENIVLGTVVDANGLIVTKASEVNGKEIKCVINGQDLDAEVLATDDAMDLALLKVKANNLTPVKFESDNKQIQSGKFVVSVDYDAEPESIGVITVKPRRFRSNRRVRPEGFLGVNSIANPDGDGVLVTNVSSRTAASKARIRNRDIILEIAGTETNTREALSRAIKKHKPGTTVSIKILRGEKEMDLEAKLGNTQDQANNQFDQWGGGPFSKRRFNFPEVIAHDSVLKPHKMGGPLLNSDGKVLGVNIARALRVSTYAIPGDKVMDFVNKHKNDKPTSNDDG